MRQQNIPNDANLNSFQRLSKPQKYAVVILAILAVAIVVFWVWQMNNKIRAPYNYNQGQEKPVVETPSDVDTLLRDRDTDQDGLSDYDEIYVYKTSPYLEDTDSDGLTDRQEVVGSSDPNCPQGKNCGAQALEIILPLDEPSENSQPEETVSPVSERIDLEKALSGEIDGATLRQLLISTGSATAEDLKAISDEDLLSSYQAALKNQSQ